MKEISYRELKEIELDETLFEKFNRYQDVKKCWRKENGIESRRCFVKFIQDNSGNHSHHIHIYQKGNPHITNELMFRDYLRMNNEILKEYERVKIEASSKFRHDPKEYVDAKYDCVIRIMDEVKSYYKNIMINQ